MSQVSTLVQAHSQDCVPGLEQGEVGSHVCLGAAVRLDVRVFSPIDLAGSIYGKLLADVYELATAVIALGRVAFSVFIRQW